MPYFVLIGRDRPGTGALRQSLRPAHQDHFFAAQADCVGVAGGPLLDDAGEEMVGTLLVFEATDRAAVERFFAGDPYNTGGLFSSVEIMPWRWGLGRPATRLGTETSGRGAGPPS
ncbi:MAG: YciI family protein [Caulobacteraceae bacterium]